MDIGNFFDPIPHGGGGGAIWPAPHLSLDIRKY